MTSRPSEPDQPATGHPAIDEALASLDLSGPVTTHADALSAGHEVLQQVLNPNGPADR